MSKEHLVQVNLKRVRGAGLSWVLNFTVLRTYLVEQR